MKNMPTSNTNSLEHWFQKHPLAHDFERSDYGFRCKKCHWEWRNKTKTQCPGLPRYQWGKWPLELKTPKQLRMLGFLGLPQNPVACSYYDCREKILFLYEIPENVLILQDEKPTITGKGSQIAPMNSTVLNTLDLKSQEFNKKNEENLKKNCCQMCNGKGTIHGGIQGCPACKGAGIVITK